MSDAIEINEGSDLELSTKWTDEDGNIVDLTGATVEIYDASCSIESYITASIVDEIRGLIDVSMTWVEELKDERAASFRIRINQSGKRTSTDQILIRIA